MSMELISLLRVWVRVSVRVSVRVMVKVTVRLIAFLHPGELYQGNMSERKYDAR